MALEKLEGCSDAYVDPLTGITLLFSKPSQLEQDTLQAILKAYKIEIGKVAQVDQLPY